jgi:ATP-dependent exoDNAse (exonuclease V) beta subunit
MQSIYRFRQAEVGLFIRAGLRGIGTISLKPLTLSANFRSDPKIIDWVNTVFENQFPAQNNMNTGAIVFKKSEATRSNSSFAKAEIKIVSSDAESEPAHVVSFIQESQAENPGGSIAVLVRARNHLSEILPALRKAGILYQGVELERLCTRPLVQDLLTLARAFIHLGDRIAWLALFRTPWCGLSLQDLWIIANRHSSLPIWFTLQSYADCVGLSDSARERLATIVPVLASALSKIQRVPLRTCVRDAWIELGGVDSTDSEAFFQILDEEGKRDFYAARVLEERVGSFFADMAEENVVMEGAVQVMTIHKAKGLEFDTVIVPGVSKKTMSESKRLLLWEEGLTAQGNYLVLGSLHSASDLAAAKHDKLYDYLRKQEAHRARYESVRLQYVAATRARERLYWLVAKN